MKLRLSVAAISDVRQAILWWRANREAAPLLLEVELRDAFRLLRSSPLVGGSVAGEPGTRRLLLSRTRYLLFYDVASAKQEVLLLRVWHTSRGRPPRLR